MSWKHDLPKDEIEAIDALRDDKRLLRRWLIQNKITFYRVLKHNRNDDDRIEHLERQVSKVEWELVTGNMLKDQLESKLEQIKCIVANSGAVQIKTDNYATVQLKSYLNAIERALK